MQWKLTLWFYKGKWEWWKCLLTLLRASHPFVLNVWNKIHEINTVLSIKQKYLHKEYGKLLFTCKTCPKDDNLGLFVVRKENAVGGKCWCKAVYWTWTLFYNLYDWGKTGTTKHFNLILPVSPCFKAEDVRRDKDACRSQNVAFIYWYHSWNCQGDHILSMYMFKKVDE